MLKLIHTTQWQNGKGAHNLWHICGNNVTHIRHVCRQHYTWTTWTEQKDSFSVNPLVLGKSLLITLSQGIHDGDDEVGHLWGEWMRSKRRSNSKMSRRSRKIRRSRSSRNMSSRYSNSNRNSRLATGKYEYSGLENLRFFSGLFINVSGFSRPNFFLSSSANHHLFAFFEGQFEAFEPYRHLSTVKCTKL